MKAIKKYYINITIDIEVNREDYYAIQSGDSQASLNELSKNTVLNDYLANVYINKNTILYPK